MRKVPAVSILFLLLSTACNRKAEQTAIGNNNQIALTATANRQAVDEGLRLLEAGGTAMDAALSVAMSEIVAAGGKHVSFAGILNLVYYEAQSGQVFNMNASFNTLKEETEPLSVRPRDFSINSKIDGRRVLVPGFLKGVAEAHKRFGKLDFAEVAGNAINLAENGITWSSTDSAQFAINKHLLLRSIEAKEIFTKADGSFYVPGDIFKQEKLAKTLKEISTTGVDYVYHETWAKKLVKTVQEYGGKLSMKDMEAYEVLWSEPAKGYYHGYEVYVHGYPSIGGASLIEALNIAEVAGLSSKGHYSTSADALHTLYLICDATEYYNGTSYSSRLSKTSAVEKWKGILSGEDRIKSNETIRSEHSANVIAVDKWGNVVALIHSINTNAWGSNAFFVGGISIPDPAAAWQAEIYEAGPGNRLVENTNPGIILKDGLPILAFSCIGGGLNNQTLASVISTLDFKMIPEEVVNLPAFGFAYKRDDTAVLTIDVDKFDRNLLRQAEKLGAEFENHPAAVGQFWSAILIDQKTGQAYPTPILYE